VGFISRLSYIYKELRRHLKDPALRQALKDRRYRDVLKINFRVGKSWEEAGGLERRRYTSYGDYLEHQRVKLDAIQLVEREREGLADYDVRYREVLGGRLAPLPVKWPGARVLCLAARLGTEVRAFRDRGAWAWGVDLNPGEGNPLVLSADFHYLPFRDAAFDAAFCNSLDHIFDLERFLGEVGRVLAPAGVLILEVQAGRAEGRKAGQYESFWWESIGALLSQLGRGGWKPQLRTPLEYPWPGELIILRHYPASP